MTETLTEEMLDAIHGENTGGHVVITLLEISWPALGTPYRFTSDNQNTVMGGHTYVPYGMEAPWPADKDGGLARSTIQLENIDPTLLAAIIARPRTTEGKITVTQTRTLAEDPNTHKQQRTLTVERVPYNELTLTLSTARKLPFEKKFPAFDFNPKDDPALFGV